MAVNADDIKRYVGKCDGAKAKEVRLHFEKRGETKDELSAAVREAFDSGKIILGSKLQFESHD